MTGDADNRVPGARATRGRRRRLGWLGAALGLVVAVAVVAWVAGTRLRSPEQAAANAAPPPRAVVTVAVERRVLEASLVTRGDVVPDVAVTVTGPAAAEGGEAVVTGLFVGLGGAVDGQGPVVEVAGRPVFVMEGTRPAYRALGPQLTGADVRQLQAALTAGGCDAGDSGLFDEETKACVAALYENAGYAVVRASATEEADLAAARTAVADAGDALADAEAALTDAAAGPTELELLGARQAVDTARAGLATATAGAGDDGRAAVTAVDDALRGLNGVLVAANPDADDDGDDGGGETPGEVAAAGSGVGERAESAEALRDALDGVASAQVAGEVRVDEAEAALTRAEAALATLEAPPDLIDEQRGVDQATQRLRRAEDELEAVQAASGPTVPLGELVFVPSLPARIDSLSAVVGEAVGAGAEGELPAGQQSGSGLMVLSSGGLVVNATVPVTDAALVAVGDDAELLDESSGVVVDATVTAVGASLTQSSGGGLAAPVTLAGVDEVPAEWSGRNVRVTFTAASTVDEVLVVPAVAVSSSADGSERVEVVATGGTISQVAVRTGLEADGFVEVTPLPRGALDEGDRVVTDR